ncbi:hypothetical protein RYX36_000085, partial [Vicia faba]
MTTKKEQKPDILREFSEKKLKIRSCEVLNRCGFMVQIEDEVFCRRIGDEVVAGESGSYIVSDFSLAQ